MQMSASADVLALANIEVELDNIAEVRDEKNEKQSRGVRFSFQNSRRDLIGC